MRWTWSTIGAVIAVAAAALVGAVVLGQAVAKDDQPSSRAEYQESVVRVRDRIDFALARIGNSQSPEELANRIDEASVTVGAGGEELADLDAPSELTKQNDTLVRTLRLSRPNWPERRTRFATRRSRPPCSDSTA